MAQLTDAQKLEYVFVTELHLECSWFIAAHNELIRLLAQGDAALTRNVDEYNEAMWSYADRMLTHAARIDRILQPDHWSSFDQGGLRKARLQFAKTARRNLPSNLFDQRDLKGLRNSIEHLNERLPGFISGKDGNTLSALYIGPAAVSDSAEAKRALRRFDPISRVCVVLDNRVELERTSESIRKLKMALPPRHTRVVVKDSEGTVIGGSWDDKHRLDDSTSGIEK